MSSTYCRTPRLFSSPSFCERNSTGCSSFVPDLDLKSDSQGYTLMADLPGIPKNEIHLELAGHVLTLSGEKKEEKVREEKDYNIHECCFGSFTRRLTLPDDADVDQVSAQQKDGVLTVRIPKKLEAQAQTISIQNA